MSIIYPISYTNGKCPHCSKDNSLRFLDKFDNKSKDPIYTANKMVCLNCNSEFFIRWIQDPDNKKEMLPAVCSDNRKQKFEDEIIKFAKENRREI